MKPIIPKSEFSRNILTIFTGASISQVLPLVIAPILTRLYTPEEFGSFALYTAIAAISGVIAAGRYEFAIMLPHDDRDAAKVTVLAILTALFIGILILIFMIFFNSEINRLARNNQIGHWLYLLPASIIFTGVHNALNYWNNRKKKYRALAINRVIQSGGSASCQLILGSSVGLMGGGLIIGSLFGQFLSILSLVKMSWKEGVFHQKEIQLKSLLTMAKIYKKFPIYSAGGALVNAAASQLPIFFITKYFGVALTGAYGLTFKVLSMPMALISSSISQVVYQKIIVTHNSQPELLFSFILRLFGTLLIISLLFVGIVALFGRDLFIFFFGVNWASAADFAMPLSIAIAVRFSVSPLSAVLSLNHNIEKGVRWQSIYLITLGITLFLASNLPINKFILVFVAHEFLLYGIYLVLILRATKIVFHKVS